MKTHISRIKAVTLSLFILALAAEPGRAQGTYTASYLGGGSWEQDGNWSTTAYPHNGHFVLINGNAVPDGNPLYNVAINIAAPCTLGIGVTVQGVSIENGSTLNLANNSRLNVNGPLTSDGAITLNSNEPGNSNLVIGNGSSLGATGAITMSDHFSNQIYARNHGDTLTIAAGGTISGAGSLNIGFFGDTAHLLNFVNQGLIEATQTNPLQVGMDSSVNANLTNTGTLRASGGGTLRLRSFGPGTVFNTGGLLEALDGSNIRVGQGLTVEGGTVTSSGTGAIRGETVGGSGGTLSNVTNTGIVAIANGENLGLAGIFTNNGLVRLDSTGNGTSLLLRSNATIAGTGPTLLGNNFNNQIGGDGTAGFTLTVAPGATIQGGGRFSGNNDNFNPRSINLVNQGLIESTFGMTLFVGPTATSGVTNTSTLRASNGSTLTLTNSGPGTVTNTGGVIEALDTSTVRVGNLVTVEGGTVTSSGTGVIRGDVVGSGGGTLSNVTNTGTVAIGPGEIVGLAGTLTNNGLVRLDSTDNSSDLLLRSNATIAGSGSTLMGNSFNNRIGGDGTPGYTLTVAPDATIQGGGRISGNNDNFNPRSIKLVNQGLIESTSGMTIFVNSGANADVTNTGTFRASNGATLAFQAAGTGIVTNNGGTLHVLPACTISGDGGISLVQTAGTIDLDGGTMNFPLGLDLNGGQLIGKGTFVGPIRNNGGRVGPGHSPGKITVNGNYTQDANGTLDIEIGGAAPEAGYDQLQVSGTAALGGILNISLINGFLPTVGDVFPFILPSAFSGTFSTINTTGFTGQVNYSASAITITILTVSGGSTPTPTPTPAGTPSQLLNISTRLRVQAGDNALIGGFILTGTAPKRVIVRAIGPSLGSAGIQGALADTVLELRDGSGQIVAQNDDWRTGGQEAEIIESTIPPSNDFESAVVVMLPANNAGYTAVVRGKNDTTGTGLVEVYDLEQSANSRLANISTRGFVETDDNAMIGGFILGGGAGGSSRVVVRAIGPSLGASGITGALQDPTLELKDANGSTVMTNDDWQSSQQAEIEATGLAPSDIHESAIVTSLLDGSYTSIVRGKDNTTGVGLVEIYNLQ